MLQIVAEANQHPAASDDFEDVVVGMPGMAGVEDELGAAGISSVKAQADGMLVARCGCIVYQSTSVNTPKPAIAGHPFESRHQSDHEHNVQKCFGQWQCCLASASRAQTR